MRTLTLAALALLSCQPIMIGNPGEASGGTSRDRDDDTSVVGLPAGGASWAGEGGGSVTAGEATGGGTSLGGVSSALAGAGGASDGDGGGGDGGDGSDGGATDEPPRILNERVQLVIYDPAMVDSGASPKLLSATLGVESPDLLAMRLMAELESVTAGHVHHEVLPFQTSMVFPPMLDGFRYTPSSYQACLANAADCHEAGVDYDTLQLEQDLCSAVQTNYPDQIWLLGAERFGFAGGKQLSCDVTEDGRSVTKTLDIVNLDYHDGFASVLFSYQVYALGALQDVFGVPPTNATAEAPDNTYGIFVQSRGRANDATASGCGDITFAPNTLLPNRFDYPGTQPSYCDTFLHYPREAPLPAAVPIGCAAWGCTEEGFRGYWFAHLPQAPWSDGQGRLNDFWRYLLSASERLAPPAISVTCSSSYEPGWCAHVIDKKRSECNVNEWAALSPTGAYVEFRFQPPRLVSGVQLFERLCEEQVLSGHLEFSDGSPPIRFGALKRDDHLPTSKTFDPKLLSGLRVVIDDSIGPHPGFSEITVASSAP